MCVLLFLNKVQIVSQKNNEQMQKASRMCWNWQLVGAWPWQHKITVCGALCRCVGQNTFSSLREDPGVGAERGKKAQGRGRILVGQHPSLRWSHWTSPGVRIFWFHSRQDCLLRVEMSWLHPNLSIQSLWGAAWESVYERLSQGNWDVWSCLRSAHVNCGRQWDKLTGSTVGRKCVCVFVRVLQQLWDEIRLLEFAKKQQGRHINQVPRMWP